MLLVIDAAIVAGCGRLLRGAADRSATGRADRAVAQGIAGVLDVLASVREATANFLMDAVFRLYGEVNPANWALNPALPTQTRTDLSVIGMTLWALVRPGSPWTVRRPDQSQADQLLTNSVRPLSSFNVPRELLVPFAASLQDTLRRSGGSAVVTANQLMAMSPTGLVVFLRDNGLLSFRVEPAAFANDDIAAEEVAR